MRDHDLDMWEREAPTPDDDPPDLDQPEDEPLEEDLLDEPDDDGGEE